MFVQVTAKNIEGVFYETQCRTSCANVLDKRGLTSSGSSQQGRDSLHCSMYCSGIPSTGVTWRVCRSWKDSAVLSWITSWVEYSILLLLLGKMSCDDSLYDDGMKYASMFSVRMLNGNRLPVLKPVTGFKNVLPVIEFL